MTWFSPIVQINFRASLTSADNWVDITSLIVSPITINRGRRSELDRYSAGSCSFTLINRDRLFDFTYAAGPGFGLLVPRAECRVFANFASIEYPLFFGFVQGWPQNYDNVAQMATVDIQCTDLFDILGQKMWSGGAGTTYHKSLHPTAWYRLVGEKPSGDSDKAILAMDYRGNSSMSFTGGAYANDSEGSPLSADADTVARFDGYGYGKVTEATIPNQTDWTIGAWFRVRPVPYATEGNTKKYCLLSVGDSILIECEIQNSPGFGTHGRLMVTLHRFAATAVAFNMFGPNIADDQWHHIVLSNAVSDSRVYVDGQLVASSASLGSSILDRLSPLTLGDAPNDSNSQGLVGWSYDLFLYESTLSDVAIDALYQASKDWGVQLSSDRILDMLFVFNLSTYPQQISTGYGRVSKGKNYSGSLLEAMQDIADAEGGQLYIEANGDIVFRNRYDILTKTNSANVQGVFGDSGADTRFLEATPTLDLQFLYNQANFSSEDGPVYSVEDTASQSDYEIRSFDSTGLPTASDNDAISAAQWLITRYSQPLARLPYVKYSGRYSTAAMTNALALKLQDLITVRRSPQGVGSQWTFNAHIEGISMVIDLAALTFEITYNLTQFGIVSGYLQIGSATYHLDNGKLGW